MLNFAKYYVFDEKNKAIAVQIPIDDFERLESVIENRPELGKRGLSVQLRATGEAEQLTALVAIKGEKLELEGVLPQPEPGGIPSHGRIGVFIAKEIIRLHGGEIHAGPGLDGPEILIAIRGW